VGAPFSRTFDFSPQKKLIVPTLVRGDSPDGVKSYENLGKAGHVASGCTFQVIACRPTSTGAIKLRSRDPRDKPVIETNFLASAEDRAALRQGLRLAEKVALSGEIAYAGGGLKRVYPVPALGPLQDLADAELDRYVRETVHTANAISGTLSMGTAPDTSAVDLQLRVHGTQGLRVVDSSVMPSLPGGQTCAHTYAIAEKAAGIILQTK